MIVNTMDSLQSIKDYKYLPPSIIVQLFVVNNVDSQLLTKEHRCICHLLPLSPPVPQPKTSSLSLPLLLSLNCFIIIICINYKIQETPVILPGLKSLNINYYAQMYGPRQIYLHLGLLREGFF